MNEFEIAQLLQEIKERILALEARVNALEAWRDDDETYQMEQSEYK